MPDHRRTCFRSVLRRKTRRTHCQGRKVRAADNIRRQWRVWRECIWWSRSGVLICFKLNRNRGGKWSPGDGLQLTRHTQRNSFWHMLTVFLLCNWFLRKKKFNSFRCLHGKEIRIPITWWRWLWVVWFQWQLLSQIIVAFGFLKCHVHHLLSGMLLFCRLHSIPPIHLLLPACSC